MTNCSSTAYARPRFRKRTAKTRTIRTGRGTPDWFTPIERFFDGLRDAFVAWQQRRADRAAFAELTEEMLRDIGTSRSELESWCAEADGRVERTRRHVAPRPAAAQANLSFFMKL